MRPPSAPPPSADMLSALLPRLTRFFSRIPHLVYVGVARSAVQRDRATFVIGVRADADLAAEDFAARQVQRVARRFGCTLTVADMTAPSPPWVFLFYVRPDPTAAPLVWLKEIENAARTQPAVLAAALPYVPPVRLTWAAEDLGRHAPAAFAVPALLPLLQHPLPAARAGAALGLQHHRTVPEVEAALRAGATEEQDPHTAAAFAAALET